MSDTTPVTDLPAAAPPPPDDDAPLSVTQAAAIAAETETEPTEAERERRRDETPSWIKNRISREANKRAQAEAERDALRDRLVALERQAGQPPQQPQAPERPEQVEARVRAEVEQQQENQRFAERCNSLAGAIQASLGQEALATAGQGFTDVGLDFAKPEHREFVADIAGLPNAAQVYYALGTDRDEAHRLLELGPRAQARELAALSARLATPAAPVAQPAQVQAVRVSRAPPPPGAAPRGAPSSSRSVYDTTQPWEEWGKQFDKAYKR